jgi:hypothetical protein
MHTTEKNWKKLQVNIFVVFKFKNNTKKQNFIFAIKSIHYKIQQNYVNK